MAAASKSAAAFPGKLQKTERFSARLSSEHKSLFEEAARVTGRSVTEFIIEDAVDRARKVLRDAKKFDTIVLNAQASRHLVEALSAAPKTNKALVASFKEYSKLVEER